MFQFGQKTDIKHMSIWEKCIIPNVENAYKAQKTPEQELNEQIIDTQK